MKIYEVAVFLIAVNFMFAIVGELGLFRTAVSNELEDKLTEDIIKTSPQEAREGVWFGEKIMEYITYIADAISLFLNLIYNTTFGLPRLLGNAPFNFPSILVNTLIAFQVVIYGVGVLSFLRGMTIK